MGLRWDDRKGHTLARQGFPLLSQAWLSLRTALAGRDGVGREVGYLSALGRTHRRVMGR
jgi:hypothetical protein